MHSAKANGMRGYHFVVNKATLDCTVARNVLSIHTTVFLDGVCTDDFSQKQI